MKVYLVVSRWYGNEEAHGIKAIEGVYKVKEDAIDWALAQGYEELHRSDNLCVWASEMRHSEVDNTYHCVDIYEYGVK